MAVGELVWARFRPDRRRAEPAEQLSSLEPVGVVFVELSYAAPRGERAPRFAIASATAAEQLRPAFGVAEAMVLQR
jgi:hypothetical protein